MIGDLVGKLPFDPKVFLGGAGLVIIVILCMSMVAGMAIWYFYNEGQKKLYSKKIVWFETVSGHPLCLGVDLGAEIKIPNTHLTVFHIKQSNIVGNDFYMPKLVYKMGLNEYWCYIRKNREVVNFVMKDLNEDMKEAKLDYDHTDMRHAKENLYDTIDRNFRSKSRPWWQEYKELIFFVIMTAVFTMCMAYILTKVGLLMGRLDPLIDKFDVALKTAGQVCTGSGVKTA